MKSTLLLAFTAVITLSACTTVESTPAPTTTSSTTTRESSVVGTPLTPAVGVSRSTTTTTY